MTKITHMPRIVMMYGLTAIILFIAGFFISGSLDISMHDTYYVISNTLLSVMIALLFCVFALITWGVNKISRRLSPILNWLHYGITIAGFVIIAILSSRITTQIKTFKDYSVYNEIEEYESQMSINEWLVIIVLILILSQLLFLINVIRAFMIKKKSL